MSQIATGKRTIAITEVLSGREFEIFELLAQGNGNLEVANILDINVSTVATYKRRIYKKLNISNLAELIKIYLQINQ